MKQNVLGGRTLLCRDREKGTQYISYIYIHRYARVGAILKRGSGVLAESITGDLSATVFYGVAISSPKLVHQTIEEWLTKKKWILIFSS
jgi:hypothetical protein